MTQASAARVDERPADTPRLGRPRDAALDARILDAALALLTERGYEHATMDEVAQRAGVAKATVYRRYATKEELAVDAVARMFESEVPVPDTGSFRGDLEQVYADSLTLGATPQGRSLIRLAITESCREPRVAALYQRWLDDRRMRCERIFDQAVERGEMRADAPRHILFDWVVGLLVLHAVVEKDRPLDPSSAVELVDFTLCGVEPR